MRVQRLVHDNAAANEAQQFADWLLQIGDGKLAPVPIPNTMHIDFVDHLQLIQKMFLFF